MTELCSGPEANNNARNCVPFVFQKKKSQQNKNQNLAKTWKGWEKEQIHFLYSIINNSDFVVTLNFNSI